MLFHKMGSMACIVLDPKIMNTSKIPPPKHYHDKPTLLCHAICRREALWISDQNAKMHCGFDVIFSHNA